MAFDFFASLDLNDGWMAPAIATDAFWQPCLDQPSATQSSDQEIVVIARIPDDPLPPSTGGGRVGIEPRAPGEGAGPGDEPECSCAGMTQAERNDRNVDAEVAEVLREILNRENQNMEYGSLIWVDAAGYVQHTSLIPTTVQEAAINTHELPRPNGLTDYSRVVAIVHSYPARIDVIDRNLFVRDDPDYLLYPWAGDWESYDSYARLITSSGGDASRFEQYIIGFDGQRLVIHEYDASDRGTDTVASGDPVSPDEQGCTC